MGTALERVFWRRKRGRGVESWCANDPLNFQAFERMEELWEGFGPLPLADADPSMLTASYGLRKITPQPRAWIGVATACVLISVSLVIWWVMHSAGVKEFSTSVGEQRREILADGSSPAQDVVYRYGLGDRSR